jgi:hypothetical protein
MALLWLHPASIRSIVLGKFDFLERTGIRTRNYVKVFVFLLHKRLAAVSRLLFFDSQKLY